MCFVVIVNCNYSKQCRRPHAITTGNPRESIVIPARQLKDALFGNFFTLQTLHIPSFIQTNNNNYISAAIFNNGRRVCHRSSSLTYVLDAFIKGVIICDVVIKIWEHLIWR